MFLYQSARNSLAFPRLPSLYSCNTFAYTAPSATHTFFSSTDLPFIPTVTIGSSWPFQSRGMMRIRSLHKRGEEAWACKALRVTRQTSYVTHRTSHITHPTSHIIRHTFHVTHHTPHHTSHIKPLTTPPRPDALALVGLHHKTLVFTIGGCALTDDSASACACTHVCAGRDGV